MATGPSQTLQPAKLFNTKPEILNAGLRTSITSTPNCDTKATFSAFAHPVSFLDVAGLMLPSHREAFIPGPCQLTSAVRGRPAVASRTERRRSPFSLVELRINSFLFPNKSDILR